MKTKEKLQALEELIGDPNLKPQEVKIHGTTLKREFLNYPPDLCRVLWFIEEYYDCGKISANDLEGNERLLLAHWMFEKPFLRDQNDSVIDFLYDLLK